ncbi:PREDICTED: SLAM family member 7 isoform X2 [Hipposideros armiger]|uniref:SLAM family member 7 isoform X2 n=1 Tax=Hipposideros armiger TaxID=186990 RepID=A0A8B7RXN5_HIPAR|nr:PREDICTED: SLAM family member 7 isoform X2 [Hipposideros armiger]
MPGSPACFILIFLLCQLTGPAISGTLKELVGAVGGSVTFPLTHSVNQIDSIVWIFNTTTLVTIQPKTADRQDNVIVIQNHNKKRVDFSHGNYSLELSKLNKSDSGAYRVEIYSSSLQAPFIQEYELHVYEHLSKPKVIMGLQYNKNGTCVTNLTCFMEQGGEDVTYSWKALGQATNEFRNGSILPISWRLGENDTAFICMARNPISSNSSNPIYAWKFCEGTIKEKKRMDTHQEVLNYHPPSGTTSEYDTISNLNKAIPEENSVNTLYSMVQIPEKMEKPHPLPTSPDTPRLFADENVI